MQNKNTIHFDRLHSRAFYQPNSKQYPSQVSSSPWFDQPFFSDPLPSLPSLSPWYFPSKSPDTFHALADAFFDPALFHLYPSKSIRNSLVNHLAPYIACLSLDKRVDKATVTQTRALCPLMEDICRLRQSQCFPLIKVDIDAYKQARLSNSLTCAANTRPKRTSAPLSQPLAQCDFSTTPK